VKKSIVVVKAARVNGDPKYRLYGMVICWTKLLNDYWGLPALVYLMLEVFRKFSNFDIIFRITKLLFATFCVLIDSFLAELPFHIRNYTDYMTWKRVTTMLLPTLRQ